MFDKQNRDAVRRGYLLPVELWGFGKKMRWERNFIGPFSTKLGESLVLKKSSSGSLKRKRAAYSLSGNRNQTGTRTSTCRNQSGKSLWQGSICNQGHAELHKSYSRSASFYR